MLGKCNWSSTPIRRPVGEAEDFADEWPGQRQVGDDNGCGDLADIPVEIADAVWVGEIVIAVEDRRKDL